MESKLGLSKFKYLITLITAAREGLLETEVVELLTESKIVDGEFTLILEEKKLKAWKLENLVHPNASEYFDFA